MDVVNFFDRFPDFPKVPPNIGHSRMLAHTVRMRYHFRTLRTTYIEWEREATAHLESQGYKPTTQMWQSGGPLDSSADTRSILALDHQSRYVRFFYHLGPVEESPTLPTRLRTTYMRSTR